MKEQVKQYTCASCRRLFVVRGSGPEPYPQEMKVSVQCPRTECLVPNVIDWPQGYSYRVDPKDAETRVQSGIR